MTNVDNYTFDIKSKNVSQASTTSAVECSQADAGLSMQDPQKVKAVCDVPAEVVHPTTASETLSHATVTANIDNIPHESDAHEQLCVSKLSETGTTSPVREQSGADVAPSEELTVSISSAGVILSGAGVDAPRKA
jgi:hypothetical protein